jgi:phosphoenolpyruvate carboxykinase (GTP)
VELTDERTIIHFGSAYGGNALLGKIAHGLRLASYDGWRSGEFPAEQFMLLGIEDTVTGKTRHVVGGFPSASDKTNLAIEAIHPGTGTIFTDVAYNELTEEVWWEGRTPAPPADVTGWRDWTGELIAERPADRKDDPEGPPQQPVHHHARQCHHPGPGCRGCRRRSRGPGHLRWPDPGP